MNDYTVILLRPDYVTDNYGQDTFTVWVGAGTPAAALALARTRAAKADKVDIADSEDYFCTALFAGHHNDLTPE